MGRCSTGAMTSLQRAEQERGVWEEVGWPVCFATGAQRPRAMLAHGSKATRKRASVGQRRVPHAFALDWSRSNHEERVLSTMLIGRADEWLLTRSQEMDGRHQAGDVLALASPILDRRSLQDRMQGVLGPVFPASASRGLATALGCEIERVSHGLLSN